MTRDAMWYLENPRDSLKLWTECSRCFRNEVCEYCDDLKNAAQRKGQGGFFRCERCQLEEMNDG